MKKWNDAMDADYQVSKKHHPTSYAENGNVEDFAESVALYVTDKVEFEQKFPNRAKLLKTIFGV